MTHRCLVCKILLVEVVLVILISKEEFERPLENLPELTPEQKKRRAELGEKMKKLTPEEFQKLREKERNEGFYF